MTIGERIKLLREKKKITQEELANSIQSTKQTIYKYENNIITNIPSDKIEKIATALDVTPSHIMGWVDKPDILFTSPDGKNKYIIEYKHVNKSLAEQTERILKYYYALNDIGKKKALDNIEDLSKIYADKLTEYTSVPNNTSFVAEDPAPYVIAAHNDHLDEEGEIEKIQADLSKLKLPKK